MPQIESGSTAIPKWFLNALSVLAIPAITLIGWLVVSVVKLQADFAAAESDRAKITVVLEEQTRELIALRLEIERLLVVKPADLYRKLEELEKRWQHLENKANGNGVGAVHHLKAEQDGTI